MENRLNQLEVSHSDISKSLQEITVSVERLSGIVALTNSKVESHIRDEKNYEQTIRNIDENVTALRVDLAKTPAETKNIIENKLAPLWESVRKHDGELQEFKVLATKEHSDVGEKVERKIQKQASVLVVVCWALIAIIYQEVREDLKTQAALINKIHPQHLIINRESK